MIIDIFKLRSKGITEQNLSLTFDLDNDLLMMPSAVFSAPVTLDGLLEIFDNEVYVSGSITYTISGECSRCLSPATTTRTVEFDDRFVPMDRCGEEEDLTLVYTRDKLDLTNYVSQLILTDLPLNLLCKEDCKGLCPVCGQDLNSGDCGHHIE